MYTVKRFLFPTLLGVFLWAVAFAPATAAASPAEGADVDEVQRGSYELQREFIYVPRKSPKKPTERDHPYDERQGKTLLHADEVGPLVIESLPSRLDSGMEKATVRVQKLARGISNLCLGWVEIPRNVSRNIRESNMGTGMLVGGLHGALQAVARTGVGAYEVLTFWSPRPNDFAVIMEPEFILDPVWGEPMPIFTDPYNNFDRIPSNSW